MIASLDKFLFREEKFPLEKFNLLCIGQDREKQVG